MCAMAGETTLAPILRTRPAPRLPRSDETKIAGGSSSNRTWVPGHYEGRWVPETERQRVWVAGHQENRWWVPDHWQDHIRNGGYRARVWVEGYWR